MVQIAIGGVVINFAAKTADAVRDVGKLDRTLDRLGDGARKSGSRMGKFAGVIGSSLPIVGAVAAGVVGLGVAFVDAGKAALEDKKQADNLANTLRKIPGITDKVIAANEDWISSMELATNVSDTELRAAISKLTLATGDLAEAQNLAKLATDVAAGSGKAYATVADAMAKAAAGNTAQLERMFPWLDKNKDGTVDLDEAVRGLGKAYTGAAEAAAANDPWKRLQTIWGMLKEALGQGMLPLLKKMGDWFKSPANRQRILDIVKALAELATTAGTKVADAISDMLDWLKSPEGKTAMANFVRNLRAIVATLQLVAHWIGVVIGWAMNLSRTLSSIKMPGWLKDQGGSGWGTGPQGNAAGVMGASAGTHGMPVVVNVYASGPDIPNTPRAVRALLDSHDLRMGRTPGRPRAMAW